jgi:hypothetical protein
MQFRYMSGLACSVNKNLTKRIVAKSGKGAKNLTKRIVPKSGKGAKNLTKRVSVFNIMKRNIYKTSKAIYHNTRNDKMKLFNFEFVSKIW